MSGTLSLKDRLRGWTENPTVIRSTAILARGLSLLSGILVLLVTLILWVIFLALVPLFQRIDRARGRKTPISRLRAQLSPKVAWHGLLTAIGLENDKPPAS